MAHSKRPKSQYRKDRDQMLKERNKKNRKARWIKQCKKRAEDEDYQKKQIEREKRLKAKPGYEVNIREGKPKKEQIKKKRGGKW